MTKKELRYSFNRVLAAAEQLCCEYLHHKTAHQHQPDYLCPAEYELNKHIDRVREYMRNQLGTAKTVNKD